MIEKIKELSGKDHVFITKSGNHAIKYALKLAQGKLLLQDQGGWITYRQFAKKFNLDVVELPTDYGLMEPNSLSNYPNSTLLINSMPGYHALQDMKEISKVCTENNILLINDVSGSIGTKEAKYGDIVLGSFGKYKPINLLRGGFIATDDEEYAKKLEKIIIDYKIDEQKFIQEYDKLKEKLAHYKKLRQKIIKDLADFEIIHPNLQGINIIVKLSEENQKERLINYCEQESLEYTLCPRYIRVNTQAASIEIKRIQSL